jgi:DNA-binding NarL/FixJ family response regulator
VSYLLKDAALQELELAIQAVLRGETYLSPAVSGGVVTDYVQHLRRDEAEQLILTSRQTEVLKLIADGLSTKDIARKLNLSIKTVDTHRSQLMKQLDIHEVAGLVRYALRVGLVDA